MNSAVLDISLAKGICYCELHYHSEHKLSDKLELFTVYVDNHRVYEGFSWVAISRAGSIFTKMLSWKAFRISSHPSSALWSILVKKVLNQGRIILRGVYIDIFVQNRKLR
ncbi:hypothetical protein M9H77_20521 [Catharanthus roseus]|uniref:Uncharacterized protein n=1 Tax=Catharanthus roseus TaxID=4058 RepID=A0ACC0AJU2_CATRO|nr:hypothetical protein M9H77_20521 [Catharanthus roseus]